MASQQDIASLGLDVSRLQKDTTEALKYYQQIIDAVEKIEGLKVTPGNYADLINKQKEAIATTQKLTDAVDNLSKAQDNVTTSTKEQTAEVIRQNKEKQAVLKTQQEEIRLAKLQADADAANAKAQQEQINIRIAKIREENEIIKQIGSEQSIEAKQRKAEAEQRILQIQEEIAVLKQLQVESKSQPTTTTTNTPVAPETPAPVDTTPQVTAVTTAYEKYTFSLRENLAQQLENEAAIAEYKAQLKALNDEITSNGGVATDAQKQKIVELREQILLLSQSNRELIATQNNLAKEMLSDEGSVNQMRAQLNSLVASYDKLTTAERATPFGQQLKAEIDTLEPQVKELEASIGRFQRNVGNYPKGSYAGLEAELRELTRQFNLLTAAQQKGVTGAALKTEMDGVKKQLSEFANGTNVALNGVNKLWGVIRQAAYIIPGLGIAGIMSFFMDGIMELISSLDLFKKKVTETKEAADTLQKAIAGTEYKKAVEEVERLTIDIDLAKKGFLDKNAVVKEYNETIGKTTGFVNDIDQAEQALIKNKEAYVQMMLYKAAATLELQKAAEAMAKAEEDRQKKEEEFASPLDFQTAPTNNGLLSDAEQKRIEAARQRDVKARKDAQIKEQTDAANQSLKIANDFEKKAADKAKEFKFNFFSDNGGSNSNISNLKSLLQQLLKAQQEGEGILLQDAIKFHQAIGDSDGFSYEIRMNNAKKASQLRIDLIKENEAAELQQIQSARDEALKTYSDAETKVQSNTKLTGDQRNKALADASKERNIAEALYEQQRLNIISKANISIKNEEVSTSAELGKLRKEQQAKDLAELAKGYADVHKNDYKQSVDFQSQTRSGLIADLIDGEQKSFEKLQTIRATNYSKQKSDLEEQYNDGEISYGKYQDSLRDIELKNQKTSLQDQLDSLTNQYAVYQKYGTIGSEAALKIKKAIEDTNAQIVHLGENLPKLGTNASNTLKEIERVIQTVASGIQVVSELISEAVTKSAEKQKQAIEAVEQRQQKAYEHEVENINNSTLSAEDKANRLKILEAERNAQTEQNQRKEQEAELKAARVQKALTIAKIITETALAVIHQLTTGDPYTATVRAIAAGAIGAAQLAIAASAPLPQFRKGTKNAPEGYAVVGEEGRELRIEPDGTMSLTPDNATVTYLQQGTQIIPHKETENYLRKLEPVNVGQMMDRSMMMQYSKLTRTNSSKNENEVVRELRQQTKAIVKGYAKNRPKMPDMKELAKQIAHEKYKRDKMNW